MASKKSVSDASLNPLEAMKIADPSESKFVAPEIEVPKPVVEQPVERAKDVAVATSAQVVATPRYKVLNKITISWNGGFATLNPGDEIGDDLYGPDSAMRMQNAGVALERIS